MQTPTSGLKNDTQLTLHQIIEYDLFYDHKGEKEEESYLLIRHVP